MVREDATLLRSQSPRRMSTAPAGLVGPSELGGKAGKERDTSGLPLLAREIRRGRSIEREALVKSPERIWWPLYTA